GVIVQLQSRILQRISNAMIDQAGPNCAHDYLFLPATGNDKSPDHDIVAGLDKGARGDVTKLRGEGADVDRPSHPYIAMGNAMIGKCSRIGKSERKRESGALMKAGIELTI